MFRSKEEQFDFYWKEIFTGLAYNPIEFNTYRFDQTTSLPGKLNVLYDMFKDLALNNQQVMNYMKEFVETFDFKIDTTVNDVLDIWLTNGTIERLINEHLLVINNSEIIRVILNDSELENVSSIPSYANANIIYVSSIIPQNNNLKFGFITDNHFERTSYSESALNHYQYLCETSKYVALDFILSNGDNVNGNSEKEKVLEDNYNVASILLTNTKTDSYILKGNHDDGSYYNLTRGNKPENIIKNAELATIYNARQEESVKRPNDNTYFFKDYNEKRIRVIGLNSYDCPLTTSPDGTLKYPTIENSGFSVKQLNWLANEALVLPNSGWKTIIFSHAPINNSFSSFVQYNDDILIGILNDFISGSSNSYEAQNKDFGTRMTTNFRNNGNLLAFVSGHIHGDGQMFYEGINCIQTRASLPYPKDERIEGTTSEYAYDVYEIDEQNNNVNIYRYGFSDFGTKRTYKLKEVR